MRRIRVLIAIITILPILYAACTQTPSAGGPEQQAPALDDSSSWFLHQGGLRITPSPQVVLPIIKECKPKFLEEIAPRSIPQAKGTNDDAQALLLGIQSIDLVYLTYYKRFDLANHYAAQLSASGSKLGLDEVLQLNTLDSVRMGWKLWGALMPLMGDRIAEANSFIKSQKSLQIYSLVVSAAWLEATRILASMALQTQDQQLRKLVAEQRFNLQRLLDCLAAYVYEDTLTAPFFESLQSIDNAYQQVTIRYDYQDISTNTKEHLTTVKSRMLVSMSLAQLKAIHQHLQNAKNALFDEIQEH